MIKLALAKVGSRIKNGPSKAKLKFPNENPACDEVVHCWPGNGAI